MAVTQHVVCIDPPVTSPAVLAAASSTGVAQRSPTATSRSSCVESCCSFIQLTNVIALICPATAQPRGWPCAWVSPVQLRRTNVAERAQHSKLSTVEQHAQAVPTVKTPVDCAMWEILKYGTFW